MSGFALHPQAYNDLDLDEICDYIAADSLDAADRIREEIYEAIRELIRFPFTGHNRPDITARPLRFQTVREYVIAYAPNEKPLLVVAIFHGRRSPRVLAAILRSRT